MPIDEYLIERINNFLQTRTVRWNTKRMFGGVCYMVDDKMCFGTYKNGFMARVGPKNSDVLVKREGAEQMTNDGRIMKGYLWVAPTGYDTDKDLEFWIQQCLDFNPLVAASKRKK